MFGSKGGVGAPPVANPSFAGTSGANSGGYVSQEVDAKEAATAPKFGDVYKQIQAKYGEKAEKPREIKKTLGKDDFLRIMITQMKNQDPTNPFKAEQMATEIAQFTSVEQLQNVNQNLNKLATQNRPLEQMSMTQMIGKTVTIDRERFPHVENQAESLSFQLPRNAATSRVAIISDGGEVVFEKELGAQKSGAIDVNWDGNKANSLPAKGGTYIMRVEAKDDRGQFIETNPQLQAKVVGVSFEGTEPVFLVGDARHQDKVTMKNIVRIDMDSGISPVGTIPGMPAVAPQPAAPVPSKKSNFIEFQPGVGSRTLGGEEISAKPAVAQALEQFAQAQPPVRETAPGAPEERGFPNGLHENENEKGGDSQ